jgi:LCP family protein required for cell wall assembly
MVSLDESEPSVVIEREKKGRWWLRLFVFFLVAVFLTIGLLSVKASTTFRVISERVTSFLGIDPSRLPEANPREENRLDILLLGFRGEDDPHGGLLTDTMIILSIDTERHETALISVPRDLYLTIPILNKRAKINEAFALGEERQQHGGGLFLAKRAVQEVLGINIDYVLAVDFRAFQDVIDLLGGVDVHVAKPLRETQQWGGIDFYVPAGVQHMDGEKALFYVRSRFTTSDFDRARRQQEVLLAIRDKALSLGFLGNPTKIADVFDILGRHIRTDITAADLPELFSVAREVWNTTPRRLVFDTASGLLYSTTINGEYVLLPTGGTFAPIRERAQNIFAPQEISIEGGNAPR